MHTVHGFETAERKVRVDLCSGDVGVAEHHLHAAQVGAVFHHVCGATVAQSVGAGGVVGALDEAPDPLPGERHAAQGKKKPRTVLRRGLFLPNRTDALKMRPPLAQILFECLDCRSPQWHNALLVAFTSNLHASRIEAEVAYTQRRNFGDAQAARIEKLENGPVAKRRGFGLGM